jgi:hypothetical protein
MGDRRVLIVGGIADVVVSPLEMSSEELEQRTMRKIPIDPDISIYEGPSRGTKRVGDWEQRQRKKRRR